MTTRKYSGIIPALYACYDKNGAISPDMTRKLSRHLANKGINGLYVGGSSGECIYQSVEERKTVLENVMAEVGGELKIIAHVACLNTEDSCALAQHAESLGVDAIAAIPPIYFKLPDHAIAAYWNDISAAAPNTEFIIYNIPQLAGVGLNVSLLKEMLKNHHVIGVKNSSMPTQDIQTWKSVGGAGFTVFNGPDEQLISGLSIGADAGIGGTYGAMPELYLELVDCLDKNDLEGARKIQYACNSIITTMCSTKASMYAVIKEILRKREDLDIGGVRAPLVNIWSERDGYGIQKCIELIDAAMKEYT